MASSRLAGWAGVGDAALTSPTVRFSFRPLNPQKGKPLSLSVRGSNPLLKRNFSRLLRLTNGSRGSKRVSGLETWATGWFLVEHSFKGPLRGP